jgi:hypothetical protein
MVDDSKYIIVPNEIYGTGFSNEAGRELERLVLDGYRIISKLSTRVAIHYVLIKFKAGTKPSRASGESAETPTLQTPSADVVEPGADASLPLDDIPF